MSYRLDEFSTPKMYQALLSVNVAVAVGATVPFDSLGGDADLSISSGLVTLRAGQYAIMSQLLTTVENVLIGAFLNGVELTLPHAQPARHYPNNTLFSANSTLVAVFLARDDDVLSVRVMCVDGGNTLVYAGNSDMTLMKVGPA